ncbi:MAG: hypothetical protein J5I94_12085 [Phaeodactylibacter sp.]|nr:hypothetical protein [Phaeodactylibacter sp.]
MSSSRRCIHSFLTLLTALAVLPSCRAACARQVDVLVIGGGASGVMAVILPLQAGHRYTRYREYFETLST